MDIEWCCERCREAGERAMAESLTKEPDTPHELPKHRACAICLVREATHFRKYGHARISYRCEEHKDQRGDRWPEERYTCQVDGCEHEATYVTHGHQLTTLCDDHAPAYPIAEDPAGDR